MAGLTQNTVDLYDEIISRHNFLTLRGTGELLHFEDGVYNLGGEDIIRDEIERLAGRCTRHTFEEIRWKIKANTYIDKGIFDVNPMLLNTVGGILHMPTMKILPHDPKMMFRTKLNARHDPKAIPTRFMKFLTEAVEDSQDRQTILEMFAAALLRNTFNPKKAVILVGDGANGKSVLLRTMFDVFGINSASAMSIHDILCNRFSKADLEYKMLNICGYTSPRDFKHLRELKSIIVGGAIEVERRYQDMFTMRPYAKMFFAINHLPDINDTDPIYRRLIIIKFGKQFKGSDCNQNLLAELTTEEEKSGILNLLVDNARKLMRQGCLTRDLQNA